MKRLAIAVAWSAVGLAGATAVMLLWLLMSGDGYADGIEGGDDTEITYWHDDRAELRGTAVPMRERFA